MLDSEWETKFTLRSVLISIQALFGANPIQNESGFEGCVDEKAENYKYMVQHANIRLATLQMVDKPPRGFGCFKDVLVE